MGNILIKGTKFNKKQGTGVDLSDDILYFRNDRPFFHFTPSITKETFHEVGLSTLQNQRTAISFGNDITVDDNLDADKHHLIPVSSSSPQAGGYLLRHESRYALPLRHHRREFLRPADQPSQSRQLAKADLTACLLPAGHEPGEIRALYTLLKGKIAQEGSFYKREELKGYIHAFFFNIFSLLMKRESPGRRSREETSRQQVIYKRFLRTVRKHYTRERRIRFYADLLCLSPDTSRKWSIK